MAIATFAALKDQCTTPAYRVRTHRNGNSNAGISVNTPSDMWLASTQGDAWGYVTTPAAPTTAVALASAEPGSLARWLGSVGTNRLLEVDAAVVATTAAGNTQGALMIYDRLSHQGGLVANVATAQTTNLPTAALTRYTNGVGVMAMLTIHTNIGSTPTTFTIAYTNEAGGASVSQVVPIATSGSTRGSFRMILIPLADGDTGVRAVASLTLALSTGTAGAMGLSLIKPLAIIPMPDPGAITNWNGLLNGGGNLPELPAGTCLAAAWLGGDSTTSINTGFELELRIGID